MTNEQDRARLVEAVKEATTALGALSDQLRENCPDVKLVMVVATSNGLGVISADRSKTKEEALQDMERALRILRDASESCGRALFKSPDPLRAALDGAMIAKESELSAQAHEEKRCRHADCHVRDGAIFVATGVKILEAAGAPPEALADLTRLTKEVCRRTHLKILEKSAVG